MKAILNTFIIFGIIVVTTGCENASEDDLINSNEVKNITYETDIKPIISNNCIACHSKPPKNGAPMPLITYNEVKDAVENRGLIDRISSTDANFLMPFGGQRLPTNIIKNVEQWKADGFPEK